MKIMIVHLSDLHLKSEGNIILTRQKQICNAIQNMTFGMDKIFIVISGDVAYSGKETEYGQATILLDYIKKTIKEYSKKEINYIIIPGNHDCDYEIGEKEIRNHLIENIQNNKKNLDNTVIDACCKTQTNFFDFSKLYQEENSCYKDKLLNILEYNYENITVVFNCYNTAWMSQIEEKIGTIHFPMDKYSQELTKNKADLTISVLHHNFNWYEPSISRQLTGYLKTHSHITLTGHEHIASKSIIDNLEGDVTEYFEGATLQEHDNTENSGFNIILIDLDDKKQKICNYKWDKNIYSTEEPNWLPYKLCNSMNKKVFKINDAFEKELNDPGISLLHPEKPDGLILNDFFINPTLRDLTIDSKTEEDVIDDKVDSDILFEIKGTRNKALIVGRERSGKTSLCKILFQHYYNNNFVPIYINGHEIKKATRDALHKLVGNCYKKQYSEDTFQEFDQLDNSKKILIIDDLDESSIKNIKYLHNFLNNLNEEYQNIIITEGEFFLIEETFLEEGQEKKTLQNYKQYEIMEFGHRLRDKLINKWNTLGKEESISDIDLLHKNDHATQIINIIIGKNYVPSYPFFLLTILQFIDAKTPYDLKESSYGYYYQLLITQSLKKVIQETDEMEAYYNYLVELAHHLFKNKIREISNVDFVRFHNWFCEEYAITLNMDYYKDNLLKASILETKDCITFRFKYKYEYYFFVAKYISNNLHDMEKKVSEMCRKLYIEEYANIVMFLTHHSKDPFILDEILKSAQLLFSEFQPIKLEDDISQINTLMDSIPKFVLENKNITRSREEKLKAQDNADETAKKPSVDTDNTDLNEDEKEVDDVMSNIIRTFKTIEIIGQILKNYYASLKGTTKFNIGQEAYSMGLRFLSFFFSITEKYMNYIIDDIKNFLEKKKILKAGEITDRDKAENISKKIVFSFCAMMSYAVIKKISDSIGSEKLSGTFSEILERNNSNSFYLVDMSIKLDFFKGFPYTDISKLKDKISVKYNKDNIAGKDKTIPSNILVYSLLRKMVIDYIYMFPTSLSDKQRICNLLDITMGTQRIIDKTSEQKKRE
ncbi:MAG: metallophosphoesterase [bacterium]|nr:metallophosphoesterase [bacterium]